MPNNRPGSAGKRASWGCYLGVVILGVLAARPMAADREFGFEGPEIFPLDRNISLLQAADLNRDGLTDLVVVNNNRSRINLLINQTGKDRQETVPSGRDRQELNALPPDARFRIESLASEKRISSIVVADLNGDGLPDLAHFGEPKELCLQFNSPSNAWRVVRKWTIPDGQIGPNALTWGDINGDHLADLMLLGETAIHALYQSKEQGFQEPERLPFSDSVRAHQILDIDGDCRSDLLLINWESPYPLRFRLQDEAGLLGPEVPFQLAPVRSFLADDLDRDGQTELITVAQNSGRAQLSKFERHRAESAGGGFRKGQFEIIPLPKTTKARRGMVWADLNQDGRVDLVVADPESGQIGFYAQRSDGRLENGRVFPCFTGVSEMSSADWDGDQRVELFLLSTDESQIGIAQLTPAGRIPFPSSVAVEGKPLALAVGVPKPGVSPLLAVILDQDGRRVLWTKPFQGEAYSQPLSKEFKTNPDGLFWHDADQDGLVDLVILIRYEKIKILRQLEKTGFEEIDLAPPGGSSEQPWATRCDIDGDGKTELLVAQKNFLRALVLQKLANSSEKDGAGGWNFLVKDQINGANGQSRIVGAAAIQKATNRIATLAMLDAEQKTLSLCERDSAGVWQIVRNLPVSNTAFSRLETVAMGEGAARTVSFLGLQAVALMDFDGDSWALTELGSYETLIKDGYLSDVVTGDLDQDGLRDLVFLETAKHHVDLVRYSPPRDLVAAARWQVFEERSYRGAAADMTEPREAVVTDLTGDGKSDLAILVHDRVLLYTQE